MTAKLSQLEAEIKLNLFRHIHPSGDNREATILRSIERANKAFDGMFVSRDEAPKT